MIAFIYKYCSYYKNLNRRGINNFFVKLSFCVLQVVFKRTVFLADRKMETFFLKTWAIMQMSLLSSVLFHTDDNIANQHPFCVACERRKLCKQKLIYLMKYGDSKESKENGTGESSRILYSLSHQESPLRHTQRQKQECLFSVLVYGN